MLPKGNFSLNPNLAGDNRATPGKDIGIIEDGFRTFDGETSLRIAPNPAMNGQTTITIHSDVPANLYITVQNHLGQLVLNVLQSETFVGTRNVMVDGSQLPNGIYYCIVWVNGKPITHKVMF